MPKVDPAAKPIKPYPEFPLTPHNSGKWAKKVRGQLYYFGRWEDPDGALREWNAAKGALTAGRIPTTANAETIVVRDMVNKYLDRQIAKLDAGNLEPRSFMDTKNALAHFAAKVGPSRLVSDLGPNDFRVARDDYAKDKGPHTVNRYIRNVKAAFNWADRNLIIHKAVAFGDGFDTVSSKTVRRVTRENSYRKGSEVFSPREVRSILEHATAPLKAMILLGLNAGFYAVDVAALPLAAIDLEDGWLEFPRTKTEVMRAAPLWPETIKAIREALPLKGKAKSPVDAGLIFITHWGNRWVHSKTTREDGTVTVASRTDAINPKFTKVLKLAGCHRKGVNFSALRDTFATIADEIPDKNAGHLIRGHLFDGMDAFYVKSVARPRLEKVTNHVRKRLLNPNVIRSRTTPKKTGRKRRGN